MDALRPSVQIVRLIAGIGTKTSSWLMIAAALAATAVLLGAPSQAKSLSLNTPLVGVDLSSNSQGVNAGVSVPLANTNVDIDVTIDAGNAAVKVEADAPGAASNAGVEIGPPEGSGSDGGGDTGNDTPDDATSDPASQPANSVSARPDEAKAATPNAAPDDSGKSPGRADAPSDDTAATQPLIATNAKPDSGTPESSNNSNLLIIDRIVAFVPAWVWVVFGLLLSIALVSAVFAWVERRRRRASNLIALVDPLTGAANVKAFDARIEQEWKRARRYDRPLGVMMIDLDRFKAVNDKNGHAAGNRVLVELTQQLSRRFRESDLVARVGGDEFSVLCPETTLSALVGLREELELKLPPLIGFDVGVSIGIAQMREEDQGPHEALERADASMYRRKRLSERRSANAA